MTTPVQYFEDLAEFAERLKRREAWVVVKWIVVLGTLALAGQTLVHSLIAWGAEPLAGVISAVALVAIVVTASLRFLFPSLEYLHCPECKLPLKHDQLSQAIFSRACPRCAYVFVSRDPPEARTVALDAEHLPRIVLEHEREPVLEPESPAPRDPTNPYAPAPDVAALPVQGEPRGNGRGFLTLLWMIIGWPILTILKSRARLIGELSPPENADSEQWNAYVESYVRSQRRAAWFMLPWTVALPVFLFVTGPLGYGWRHWQNGNAWQGLWQWCVGIVVCFVIGAIAMFAAWVVASLVFRRHFARWLKGNPAPAKAAIDDATGYYALRLRFTDVESQQQLPTVSFRFRQKTASDLVVRVVNVAAAQALEKTVPCPEPNAWQPVEIDLRALVRQSDPQFFGDELHLTGDPAGELEVTDFDVVRQ